MDMFQEVGGIHRDEAVSWLVGLNSRFHFTPETVALSIAMTDRFLNFVKVMKLCASVVLSYNFCLLVFTENKPFTPAKDMYKMNFIGVMVGWLVGR